MKISEYIKLLQKIQEKDGDVEVYEYTVRGVSIAKEPESKNLRILSKRESRQDYWEKWRSACTEENKGEKVVAI